MNSFQVSYSVLKRIWLQIQILFHTKGKQFDPNQVKIYFNDNEPDQNLPSLITELERYHDNHLNKEKQAYKLLGIYFDEHLII
jgi:hypothetical protein